MDGQPRAGAGTARRLFGSLLIIFGLCLAVAGPVGTYYLAALACGMGTTGCSHFEMDWLETAPYWAPPLLIGLGLVWWGRKVWRG